MALRAGLHAGRRVPRSHAAPPQVLGTLKEILGGRKPAQHPVIFRTCAETLRLPEGSGRHPHHSSISGPSQRLPHGQKEATLLLRGVLPNGFPGRYGLLCLLVFKKEIHVVNAPTLPPCLQCMCKLWDVSTSFCSFVFFVFDSRNILYESVQRTPVLTRQNKNIPRQGVLPLTARFPVYRCLHPGFFQEFFCLF